MADRQYRIETIHDILRVPSESRAALFRELETALELHEFVFGEKVQETKFVLTWIDDGDHSLTITSNGEPVCKLEITEGESNG